MKTKAYRYHEAEAALNRCIRAHIFYYRSKETNEIITSILIPERMTPEIFAKCSYKAAVLAGRVNAFIVMGV